jgi:hypothetical protein
MSLNDPNFASFGRYNFAVDVAWQENISNATEPFVPPKGEMIYLNNADMIYLDGDRMVYLET